MSTVDQRIGMVLLILAIVGIAILVIWADRVEYNLDISSLKLDVQMADELLQQSNLTIQALELDKVDAAVELAHTALELQNANLRLAELEKEQPDLILLNTVNVASFYVSDTATTGHTTASGTTCSKTTAALSKSVQDKYGLHYGDKLIVIYKGVVEVRTLEDSGVGYDDRIDLWVEKGQVPSYGIAEAMVLVDRRK
jgi:hypothetical protein